MNYRTAVQADCRLLAELNHQLIQDEGHRNQMTMPELEHRMREWVSGGYRAVIYEEAMWLLMRFTWIGRRRFTCAICSWFGIGAARGSVGGRWKFCELHSGQEIEG